MATGAHRGRERRRRAGAFRSKAVRSTLGRSLPLRAPARRPLEHHGATKRTMAHDWRNPERVVPWKPRQRFEVTMLGREALERYRAAVHDAQQGPGPRAALDEAKRRWAEALRLRPADGILLEDLTNGHNCLADLKPTLEACDLTLRDARGTIDRLLAAHLIAALDPAPRV